MLLFDNTKNFHTPDTTTHTVKTYENPINWNERYFSIDAKQAEPPIPKNPPFNW